jgi:hypothetical protein
MKNNLLFNKLIRLHKEELYDSHSSPSIFLIIKKDEMGGACSTYGEEDKLEGRGPFGKLCRRWRIILKTVFKKWEGGMVCTDVALDRDRWRALMIAVMNIRVS